MPTNSTASTPPAIILVEDDAALREALEFSLVVDGFTVRSASCAAQALDFAEDGADCLIVDHILPDMNGLSLIRRLRKRGVRAPAIIITSNPTFDVRQRAAAQAVQIVEKPLIGNDLIHAVRDVCGGR